MPRLVSARLGVLSSPVFMIAILAASMVYISIDVFRTDMALINEITPIDYDYFRKKYVAGMTLTMKTDSSTKRLISGECGR
ncbi:MAG: hypothetical protein FWH40_04470 [Coriobacteriia bacterium]|nr:hypothetical protein [Coriobacteriia bacterium]